MLLQNYTLESFGRVSQIDAVNIDFTKAFDKLLSHTYLMVKQRRYGVIGALWS